MMEALEFQKHVGGSGKGFSLICGVDEAGRGPLAGEVYAAAVILPECYELPDMYDKMMRLRDSKKCTEQQRETLFAQIQEQAISFAVRTASLEEIERLNILGATMLAMRRAVEALQPPAAFALIDGNRAPELSIPLETVVQGDAQCACIAAASILAKVSRDHRMLELDAQFPGYGFAQHKGYGTKAHYEAIAKLGVSPVHRLGFRLGSENAFFF